MAGLGTAQPPTTDALGQLLSEYTKRLYTSQLQHLKVLSRSCCLAQLFYFSYPSYLYNFSGHSWHTGNRGG
jgi:hypothetical protein